MRSSRWKSTSPENMSAICAAMASGMLGLVGGGEQRAADRAAAQADLRLQRGRFKFGREAAAVAALDAQAGEMARLLIGIFCRIAGDDRLHGCRRRPRSARPSCRRGPCCSSGGLVASVRRESRGGGVQARPCGGAGNRRYRCCGSARCGSAPVDGRPARPTGHPDCPAAAPLPSPGGGAGRRHPAPSARCRRPSRRSRSAARPRSWSTHVGAGPQTPPPGSKRL